MQSTITDNNVLFSAEYPRVKKEFNWPVFLMWSLMIGFGFLEFWVAA